MNYLIGSSPEKRHSGLLWDCTIFHEQGFSIPHVCLLIGFFRLFSDELQKIDVLIFYEKQPHA
jgi:hypothetical protein